MVLFIPASVVLVITVSSILVAIGGTVVAFVAGHLASKLLDAITNAFAASTSDAVLFKANDDAMSLGGGAMRICLVTKASSWMRKVRILSSLSDGENYKVEDLDAGDNGGYEYNAPTGNVKWMYTDILVFPGCVVEIQLFRDTYFSGWVDCGMLNIDAEIQSFRNQCLMIYWDDDNGTFFINKNLAYTFNTLFKQYMKDQHLSNPELFQRSIPKQGLPTIAQRAAARKPKDTKKELYGDGKFEKTLDPAVFYKDEPPANPKPYCKTKKDLDGDGIVNSKDNDMDGDGIVNKKDKDKDGDGIVNKKDNDMDGDGIVNKKDKDMDGDGIVNKKDKDKDGDGKKDKPAPVKPAVTKPAVTKPVAPKPKAA
ncbi:hypothetical protein SAMD00019534_019770, partial [Acytostelium subglobosum LB1]|uniref:hypothetical protein n=1 Tax=Acytostelium subglobosum LB1 TaxID=1410327 RepID=UPI000644F077